MQENFELRDYDEKLAHTFLEEYLAGEGYSFETIGALPPERLRKIMIRASVYTSMRLAEIEDRAQLVSSLHHATDTHS